MQDRVATPAREVRPLPVDAELGARQGVQPAEHRISSTGLAQIVGPVQASEMDSLSNLLRQVA